MFNTWLINIVSGLIITGAITFNNFDDISSYPRTRRRDHITPMLIKLHWLPVRRRIEYKILSLTYRAIHRQAPQYLCDMLPLYQPARALRSQSTLTLTVPRSRTKTYGDRCFPKAAALLWNSLPANLRDTNSIAAFQRGLKTLLFRQEYEHAM